jgi:hypothetical protein
MCRFFIETRLYGMFDETEFVRADRDADSAKAMCAFRLIVLCEEASQTSNLHANCRVELGVEVLPTAERLRGNSVFADLNFQVLPEIQEKLTKSACTFKALATQYFVNKDCVLRLVDRRRNHGITVSLGSYG